jgi:hypothetical protein
MARLRNRIRRRVAAPIEEPAADEQEEPEDEADEDEQEAEPGRPDPTARALQEDAYSRRTSGRGELGDIAPSEISDLSQQVTTGSAASVSIADQFDPGFTRTEIVNRLGMVLSLSFSYDYGKGEWVPDPIDKTERQAVEQQLAEDRATNDLNGSVDAGSGTTVDSNGDLKLDPGTETENDIKDSPDGTVNTKGQPLFEWDNGPASGEVTGTFDGSAPANPKCELQNLTQNTSTDFISMNNPDFAVPFSGNAGDNWSIRVYREDENYWDPNEYRAISTPLSTEFGDAWGQAATGETSGDFYAVDKVGSPDPSDEGTAKSTFDNPCTATSTRSAQYDVCSRSSDVTIRLYEGDPDDPDSILLRDDISQREDITDIPDSRTDLQYQITIKRGPDGESPKVSRLGHQLIR